MTSPNSSANIIVHQCFNSLHLIALVSFPLRAECDSALMTMALVSLEVFQLSVEYVAPTDTRPVEL